MSIHFITIRKKTLQGSLVVILAAVILLISSIIIPFIQKEESPSISPTYEDNAGLQAGSTEGGKLAIVIDDFGSSRDGVEEMMSIKRPLTFAVMPFLTHSESDARNAHDRGYEVIVHLPMEPFQGKKSWLGPKPVMSDMENEEIMEIVRESIENIPYAKGLNNHMGSKATSRENVVSSVLEVLKEKNLYFVDSLTSGSQISKKIAEEKGIPYHQRNIFLDGQKPKSYVINQLKKAGELALKNGHALAIGHVGIEGGKVVAEAINEMIPEFDRQNIQLVFVSDLPN